MSRSSSVAVSAPGKVFLAGGYLVLDRRYTALVFGLSARIHVIISPVTTSPGVILSEIVVKSPQFLDAIWEYGYRLSPGAGGVEVTELRADADIKLKRNLFIETTLTLALSYVTSITSDLIPSSNITILADNDYYSTSGLRLVEGARFHDFGVPLSDANKTGLGSSAALVTALTAALLKYYLPDFDIDSEHDKRRLHNLAQASHCAAQGKIGSGFDVASAVYGSCLYRRFTPSLLTSYGETGVKGFSTRLKEVVDETGKVGSWDYEIIKGAVQMPRGLRLVMCDVKGGSETPGMVKKVLAWRERSGAIAEELWQDLQKANTSLADELVRLRQEGGQDYKSLKDRISAIRSLIRKMSTASGVPVEPPEQTRLLDACSSIPGVIGGVVPGAGGHDAIVLLIEDKAEVLVDLQNMFSKGELGNVSVLGVREEMEGIRAEDVPAYKKQ